MPSLQLPTMTQWATVASLYLTNRPPFTGVMSNRATVAFDDAVGHGGIAAVTDPDPGLCIIGNPAIHMLGAAALHRMP